MALKTFKPNTPGQRQLVIVDRSGLWRGKPVKSLTEGLSKSGGRNNLGRTTSYSAAAATSAPIASLTSSA
jgi:large subunit ribosomal protein L2